MKFEVVTYSRSALNECVGLVKKTSWTVAKKNAHFSKCFEVRKVFDFCLEKTGCCLFEAEYSPWKEYLRDVNLDMNGKGISKKELDIDLRRCYTFVCNEINGISTMMATGEVNEIA